MNKYCVTVFIYGTRLKTKLHNNSLLMLFNTVIYKVQTKELKQQSTVLNVPFCKPPHVKLRYKQLFVFTMVVLAAARVLARGSMTTNTAESGSSEADYPGKI